VMATTTMRTTATAANAARVWPENATVPPT
jgi:hypothetical protein